MKVNISGLKNGYQMDLDEARSSSRSSRPAGASTSHKASASLSVLQGKDQATLSDSARLLAKTLTGAESSPEARAEMVRGLKEQVETGNYQIPHEQLAQRLLSRLHLDNTAEE